MKDRVREAIFNLLGPGIAGKHAVDLFAGTGALGFEAISRGAARATLIDRHFPTADLIRQNAAALGIADRCEVVAADTFFWTTQRMPVFADPLAAFVSPPYDFYVERLPDMLSLVQALLDRAHPVACSSSRPTSDSTSAGCRNRSGGMSAPIRRQWWGFAPPLRAYRASSKICRLSLGERTSFRGAKGDNDASTARRFLELCWQCGEQRIN